MYILVYMHMCECAFSRTNKTVRHWPNSNNEAQLQPTSGRHIWKAMPSPSRSKQQAQPVCVIQQWLAVAWLFLPFTLPMPRAEVETATHPWKHQSPLYSSDLTPFAGRKAGSKARAATMPWLKPIVETPSFIHVVILSGLCNSYLQYQQGIREGRDKATFKRQSFCWSTTAQNLFGLQTLTGERS